MPYMSLFGTREVGMSVRAFGAFMALTVVSNILIGNVLARRSDQMTSRRPVLPLSSAAGALGYLGYAFVRDAWSIVPIGTLVLGIASLTFSQLFAQARETLGRANIKPAEAPLYMNAFRMTYALSWTVGPALAAFTLREASFRGLFIAASLLHVVLFGGFGFVGRTGDPKRSGSALLRQGNVIRDMQSKTSQPYSHTRPILARPAHQRAGVNTLRLRVLLRREAARCNSSPLPVW